MAVDAAHTSLAELIDARIARLDTRTQDWDALKFQEKVDPRFRRAQMRYVGTGAAGVRSDSNTVPSEHFTLRTPNSTQERGWSNCQQIRAAASERKAWWRASSR